MCDLYFPRHDPAGLPDLTPAALVGAIEGVWDLQARIIASPWVSDPLDARLSLTVLRWICPWEVVARSPVDEVWKQNRLLLACPDRVHLDTGAWMRVRAEVEGDEAFSWEGPVGVRATGPDPDQVVLFGEGPVASHWLSATYDGLVADPDATSPPRGFGLFLRSVLSSPTLEVMVEGLPCDQVFLRLEPKESAE